MDVAGSKCLREIILRNWQASNGEEEVRLRSNGISRKRGDEGVAKRISRLSMKRSLDQTERNQTEGCLRYWRCTTACF